MNAIISSGGAMKSILVAAGPVKLVSVTGYSPTHPTPRFLQIHDSETEPVEGAVPVVSIAIADADNFSVSLNDAQFSKAWIIISSAYNVYEALAGGVTFFAVVKS